MRIVPSCSIVRDAEHNTYVPASSFAGRNLEPCERANGRTGLGYVLQRAARQARSGGVEIVH